MIPALTAGFGVFVLAVGGVLALSGSKRLGRAFAFLSLAIVITAGVFYVIGKRRFDDCDRFNDALGAEVRKNPDRYLRLGDGGAVVEAPFRHCSHDPF